MGFSSVKTVAKGIGLILKEVIAERERREDLLEQIKRISDATSRLLVNVRVEDNASSARLREKAVDAMTAVVVFFNSILVYSSHNYFGITVKKYEAAKNDLKLAIAEYDQANWDFIASSVSRILDIVKRIEVQQDDKLMTWLSSSNSFSEARLIEVREKRTQGTLQWADKTHQFNAWRSSVSGSQDTVLWIAGGPGFGKSVLAGYYIDALQDRYRNSQVVYFFCRRGEDRLSNIRDVIRTLAFQCFLSFPGTKEPRALVELRSRKDSLYDNESSLSVTSLMAFLLDEILQEVRRDVFIVIDGLDEVGLDAPADQINAAQLKETGIQERERFITRLGTLVKRRTAYSESAIRLLIISRPEVKVDKLIPDCIGWHLGYSANEADIQKYVSSELKDRDGEMNKKFKAVDIDPFDYFCRYSGGIFLWVWTVFRELSVLNTKEKISERLKDFRKVSGMSGMEELYCDILSRISDSNKEWVAVVLKWLLIAEEPFDVHLLQSVVESSLKQEFVDFSELLKSECGSLVRISSPSDNVNLIHETLLSVLLDLEACPPAFKMNRLGLQGEAAKACIQILYENPSVSSPFRRYASKRWDDHLKKAPSSGVRASDLLLDVKKLFTHPCVDRWIHYALLNDTLYLDICLSASMSWLMNWRLVTQTLSSEVSLLEVLQEAMSWRDKVIESSTAMYDCVGKAAVRIWIRGLDMLAVLGTAFETGFKCYQKCHGKPTDVAFTSIDLQNLLEWGLDEMDKKLPLGQVVVAYWAVENGDKVIQLCELYGNDQDLISLKCLADVYLQRSEYFKTMTACQMAAENWPADVELLKLLGKAYTHQNAYQKGIDVYQKIVELAPDDQGNLEQLARLYGEVGKYEKAIQIFQNLHYALQVASRYGHLEVVKSLLEAGADVDSKSSSGRTPLSRAAENGHLEVVKSLLEAGADVDSEDSEYGQTPLSWAAENGHLEVVKSLLEAGADVDSKSNSGRTPLSWAAENGYRDVVALLEKLERDRRETETEHERSPIITATEGTRNDDECRHY